jgi:hypothetical protein
MFQDRGDRARVRRPLGRPQRALRRLTVQLPGVGERPRCPCG